MSRLLLALALALAAAATAAPAAHPLSPRFVPIVDGVSPSSPRVVLEAKATGSMPRLTVRVSGARVLEITGVHGEPFLRVGAKGAHVNVSSTSAVLLDRAEAPGPASPEREPRWKRVSSSGPLGWFEPRSEYPLNAPPRDVESRGSRATVHRWEIPATYDGKPVVLRGHVDWIPSRFDPTLLLVAVAGIALFAYRFRPWRRRSV